MITMDDECRIIAWKGWNAESIEDKLQDMYYDAYGGVLKISWTTYTGGNNFAKLIEQDYPNTDVVIGDREMMCEYATQGRLVPFDTQGHPGLFSNYPEWLLNSSIRTKKYIFSVPCRWGTTSMLLSRRIFDRTAKSGDTVQSSDVFAKAGKLLVWNPGKYSIPSMAFIARCMNPGSPFVLTDTQFQGVKRICDQMLSKGALVSHKVVDFISKIENADPDVVLCAGDWILRYMEERQPESYEMVRKKYEFVYPDNSPFAFFEMVGTLATAKNRPVGERVRDLLIKEDLRNCVERLDVDSGGYWSNPTHESGEVPGPGYTKISVKELLSCSVARQIPRNQRMRPQYSLWQDTWREFMDQAYISEKKSRVD